MPNNRLTAWTEKDTKRIVAAIVVWSVGLGLAGFDPGGSGGLTFVGVLAVTLSSGFLGLYYGKWMLANALENDMARAEHQPASYPPTTESGLYAAEKVEAVRHRIDRRGEHNPLFP